MFFFNLDTLLCLYQELLVSSGATNFFTLVRYNPPELLDDYLKQKKEEKYLLKQNLLSDKDLDKFTPSMSDTIETSSTTSETPEQIIFTLFGPRVWEHEGLEHIYPIKYTSNQNAII